MFNANSVWFGPGEEKAPLPLVYLSSISALLAWVKTNCACPAVPASALANHPAESVSTNCSVITRLNLKKYEQFHYKVLLDKIFLAAQSVPILITGVLGKGVSFKYRHDPNSQWRIKICKMQATIKAMIKCAHLNMSQLYIHVSELLNISVLSRFLSPVLENPHRETDWIFYKRYHRQSKVRYVPWLGWCWSCTHNDNCLQTGATVY